jgi:hypothetical protein
MPEKEILRNERWLLGIIRHYEGVSRNKAKKASISVLAEQYFTLVWQVSKIWSRRVKRSVSQASEQSESNKG